MTLLIKEYYNVYYCHYYIIRGIIVSILMLTPQEMQLKIAQALRAKRLTLNLSQQTLAAKAGVSYSVLKKFERTGQISLESLLKLALALGAMQEFNNLFMPQKPEVALSLDELMVDNTRKRGRK